MSSVRKQWLVPLAMVLASFTLFGCTGRLSPQETAAKAVSAGTNIETLRMEKSMSVALVIAGGSAQYMFTVSEHASGFADMARKQAQSTTEYSGKSTGQTGGSVNARLQLYTVDGWAYMKGSLGPAGEAWLKTKLSDNIWAAQSQNYQPPSLLKAASEITSLGSETVDGIDSYVLQITPSMDSLTRWLLYQSQEVGLALTTFNLPDSLKSSVVKEWIAKDSYLPVKLEVRVMIEIRPGDIPGLPANFDKLTLSIDSQTRLYDYGKQNAFGLPPEADKAEEVAYGQMGLSEYMNYRPLASPSAPSATPPPSAAGAAPSPTTGGKTMQWPSPPTMSIDSGKQYTATIKTNLGDIVIQLFPKDAPLTVNSFVFLARQGFYDGVKFHRVVKGFVIQTGDPTGTGTGGPGYRFADEKVTRDYVAGTLAMANSGPNTNGSQFFITLADLSGQLPKNYTIFGLVTGGADVVQKLGNVPVKASPTGEASQPTVDVHVNTITIEEK